MEVFPGSLRGYAYKIHKRDNFRCRYCGLNGAESFDKWLSLSLDHLLPKENPLHNNPDYTVTACMFCNTADNQYFHQASKRGLKFDSLTPEQLVAQRKVYVEKTRENYREFWERKVKNIAYPNE